MSAIDLEVLYYIKTYGIPILCTVCLILLLVNNFKTVRNWLLTRIVFNFDVSYEQIMIDHKRNLFLPLHNIESKDWELRNKGLIRILEIGFRTGENIKYYPKNCHLLVVDRNVYIQSYLDSNPNLTNNVNLENVFVLSGESLKAISDNSVDAVVGTYVLCTATRVDQLLSEIKRVLTPKGLYFFLEHNPEPQNTFLHKVQNILTITKLWPIIFDGCHLNRRTEQDIKAAQFSDLTYQFITVSSDHNMFSRFIRTHVIGSAIK